MLCYSMVFLIILSQQTIGKSAFCYCSGLTSISIPSSVVSIGENAFSSSFNRYFHHESCVVYVPTAAVDAYLASSWNKYNIVGDDTKAGIVESSVVNEIVEVYTLDGRRIENLRSGINIVRMSDGTTKKVYVK